MTIAVKKNVLAGSGARKSLRYGWEQVPRAFLVTGLSDTTQAVYPSALAAATAADSTFALGQRHPTTGMTLCVAQDVEFTPEGPHAVKVTMTYKRNESVDETTGGGETKPCEIEVGATLQQESTNVDVNGSVMQISYTPTGESMSVPYKGTVSVMRPRRTLTFSRTEATSPAYKASQYVGKVNSGSWPGIETAATAREYLCSGIVGRSNDGGESYAVTYTFEDSVDPSNSWDAFVYAIDPATGRPPEGVHDIVWTANLGNSGNGWGRFQMYKTIDFDGLKLLG
jgi:hypothetical protein